jgi:beta-lactamase class A
MRRKIILLILFSVVLSVGALFSYKIYRKYQTDRKEQILLERRKVAWAHLERILQNKVRNFKGTVGLVIEDLDNEWEISFNKDTLIPSASLVKVPIMLACFYAAEDGKINLNDEVRIKSSEIVSGSKEMGNKVSGSAFTVEELFRPMITESDNTAANALIDLLGFDASNEYFKKMGLKNTNIARKMLDFEKRKEGEENYTTAQDMAYLLEGLYHESILNKDASRKCMELLGEQKINDRIPRKLPKGTFVAHKTGLEKYVCHDAGIVFTNKGNFLICILTKHNDNFSKSTKKFISDVTLLTYNYYQDLY